MKTGYKFFSRYASILFIGETLIVLLILGASRSTLSSINKELIVARQEVRKKETTVKNLEDTINKANSEAKRLHKEIQKWKKGRVVNLPITVSNKTFFTSYAEEFEDLILYNLFSDIEEGFYVDVGAANPIAASVTKVFYEKGWHGINIEPLVHEYKELMKDRPRDINLCLAAGATEANLTQYGLGRAASLLPEVAQVKHLEVSNGSVPVVPLAKILDKYCTAEQVIHFLKIDVEGFEKDVILGTNFEQYHPLVLLIEAKDPIHRKPVYNEWEDIILSNGYDFVYDHYLNRYYIDTRAERLKLRFKPVEELLNTFIVAKMDIYSS